MGPDFDSKRLFLLHRIAGVLLTVLASLALVAELNNIHWANDVWRIGLLILGVVVLLCLYALRPLEECLSVWAGPRQRDWTIIGLILAVAGTVEIVLAHQTAMTAFTIVGSTGILMIGFFLMTIARHRLSYLIPVLRRYEILGATVVMSGTIRVLSFALDIEAGQWLWSLILLGGGLQLCFWPVESFKDSQ